MKRLIVPIIVALLIVSLIAVVTEFFVMPRVSDYINSESKRIGAADAKFRALQVVHKTTPQGRFKQGDISAESLNRSSEELDALVEAGSMTFDNPEINILIEELKRRLEEVQKREARVDQVQSELDLRWDDLEALTNKIDQARLELDKRLEAAQTLMQDTEQKGLKAIATMFTGNPPAEAVTHFRGLSNVLESAKILYFMPVQDQANVIRELNARPDEHQKLAREILQEFKKISMEIPEANGG